MKLASYPTPATQAVELAKEANVLGAICTLSTMQLDRLSERNEAEIVESQLARELAHEMMKTALVHRSVVKTESQYDPTAIEYRAEIVVIPRDVWRGMMDALAHIARKERVGAESVLIPTR